MAAPVALAVPTAALPPGADVYLPVDPRRAMNRVAVGAGATYTLTIPGVPAGATAVELNVTATGATRSTYVSACAAGTALATCKASSALNPAPGLNTPAAVLVALGGSAGNQVTFYNNVGSVQLIADVQGFYVPAGTAGGSVFVPLSPTRALNAQGIGANSSYTLTLSSVPAGATAVALNLTGTRATQTTYISACPTGLALATCKTASVLNPTPGLDLPNLAVVKLGGTAGNQVTLYNNAGSVAMIADVQGYFVNQTASPAGGSYLEPVAPQRVLAFQPMGRGTTYTLTLPNVPAGATAVALNVTSTGSAGTSYVSTCPAGTTVAVCTRASTLNPRYGTDTANNVLLKLGGASRNQVTLYNNAASTYLMADLQGYFIGDGTVAPAPVVPAFPNASTTGVPDGTPLTVHNGDLVVTTSGAVVENMDIRGFVKVSAANVTIRNTVVRGRTPGGSVGLVTVSGAYSSATIVDSTLVASTASPYVDGVRGANFTLTRVEIANVIDQVHIYGGNVQIEDSWLHDNAHFVNDPNWGGGPSHDDNIQIQSGSNISITGSSISGSNGAGIMLTQDAGAVSDLRIAGNLLDGGACTVNVKTMASAPQNVALADNTFGRNATYWGCGIKVANSIPLDLQRNYFTDGATVGRTP